MTRLGPVVICKVAIGLAILVILVGGWTRIMDAGLGCPDWPGCFGQLTVPDTQEQIALAEQRFAGIAVDVQKGSIEMLHRYMAGALGLLILILALIGWRRRHQAGYPWLLSQGLLALVVMQGLFGMWTVTLKLHPLVVTGHLLGGLLTLTLLIHLVIGLSGMQQSPAQSSGKPGKQSQLINFALGVLFLQMILGGWTSANYAGWACNHWFSCAEQSVELDFATGFSPVLIGQSPHDSYLGGVLPHPARAAIQMTHRAGALLVIGAVMIVVAMLWKRAELRLLLMAMMALLTVQIGLGIANAMIGVPVELAIAHHGIAVALLLNLLWLKYSARYSQSRSEVTYVQC